MNQLHNLLALAVLILSLAAQPVAAQTPSALQWLPFDEAVERAKAENKKLLVDVYTDWCGWCKKMDKEVYANVTVGSILTRHFVLAKLNAEGPKEITYKGTKLTQRRFAAAVGVTGYPSTIFLEPDAKPITLLPGFVPAPRFVTILRYIGENHYKTVSFEEYLKKSGTVQ
jgi:thioredoxin-related protein